MNDYRDGVFQFSTKKEYSALDFLLVTDNATVYHDQYTARLKSGVNIFPYAGEYTIRGGFLKVSIADTYPSPFHDGALLRWDDTGTIVVEGLFMHSTLDAIVQPPSTVHTISHLFSYARNVPDITIWDMSNVKTMHNLFEFTNFNQDISGWDVSNLENARGLFENARTFDHDLSRWDVSNVYNFDNMFRDATSFNNGGAPLIWDTSSAVGMRSMFSNARSFNQDVSSWDVSNVSNFQSMFSGATAFNNGGKELVYWDMSNATFLESMLEDTINFQQDLRTWNVDKKHYGKYFAHRSMIDGTEYLPEVLQHRSFAEDVL